MTKQKIIVSVTNDLFTDNRVKRVCDFLVNHDFEVTLVGRKLKNSQELPKTKYKTKRFKLWFTKGALFYANYNMRLFFYLLFHKVHILVANDLDTLLANHLAKKFKRHCTLIYDSHEYFIGVPELIHRPKVQNIWRKIEKRCLPKADKMYTVNESIADLYRKEYKREISVVRNISSLPEGIEQKSKEELGLPTDKKIIIYQGAGINIDRGAEELIDAMKLVENGILIFVGSGDVINQLKEKVIQQNLQSKVIFFGKKTYSELLNYTRLADVGVSIDKDTNINYRYSLPNKLFDYIHCGIPVLVSPLPEIKKIVEKFNVGLIISSHEPTEIAAKLNQLFSDPALLIELKSNTKQAAAELTWEQESKVLEKIYL